MSRKRKSFKAISRFASVRVVWHHDKALEERLFTLDNCNEIARDEETDAFLVHKSIEEVSYDEDDWKICNQQFNIPLYPFLFYKRVSMIFYCLWMNLISSSMS